MKIECPKCKASGTSLFLLDHKEGDPGNKYSCLNCSTIMLVTCTELTERQRGDFEYLFKFGPNSEGKNDQVPANVLEKQLKKFNQVTGKEFKLMAKDNGDLQHHNSYALYDPKGNNCLAGYYESIDISWIMYYFLELYEEVQK